MCVLWLLSERTWEAGPLTLFALFQAHYLQRAFIFPLLMRGASKMPYNPSFHPQLRVIAEYDSKDFALGATYLLFKHLHVKVEMQRMKYFSGGLTYKIHLK